MNKRELKGVLTRPIAFHRIFAQIGGGVVPGLFLSQAHYWSDKTHDPDGWFYKTREEWEQETGLKRDGQETARRELKKRRLMEEELRGLPAKLHYRVDYDVVCAAIEAYLSRLDAPAPEDDNGEPSRQLGVTNPTSRVHPTQPDGAIQPNKMEAKAPTLSTENTAESTQIPERSKLNEKTNGSATKAAALEDAALSAFARLDDEQRADVQTQMRLTGRSLSDVMWDLYGSQSKAMLLLRAGK